MRVPSYSSVLGFALLAGLIAAGVSLVRNLPDTRRVKQWQRDQTTTPQPEDNPSAVERHLARGENLELASPDAARRYFRRWRDAVEDLLVSERPGYQNWYAAGWARSKAGDTAAAEDAWRRAAVALDGDLRPESLYNLACCLALVGDSDAALTELGHAVDAGWNDRAHTRDDRDLVILHTDPRFWRTLDRMTQPRPRGPRRLSP